MNRLGRPDVWLPLALILTTIIAAFWLASPECSQINARDLEYYWARHYWMSAFNALSATCGVGMLAYDFGSEFTEQGRWVLTAAGLIGAVLFLAAAAQAVRRLHSTANRESVNVPHPLLILSIFVCAAAFMTPLTWTISWVGGGGLNWPQAVRQSVAAFASLGWLEHSADHSVLWATAVVALLGGLGWPLWLAAIPAARRRYWQAHRPLVLAAGYIAFILLAALLFCVLESPRGGRTVRTGDPSLSAQQFAERYERSVLQTVLAATAGMPTENLSQNAIGDGSKMVLAAVVLTGGMGGSPTGGVKWPLMLIALSAGGATFLSRSRQVKSGSEQKTGRDSAASAALFFRTAVRLCVLLVGWTTIVAIGLLIIEARTASAFQTAPTFADAFLDASAVVGGANLTSGLSATVTNPNLSSGMGQSVDLYHYGTIWLMLGMAVGRILPVLVLCRMADSRSRGGPTRTPLI